MTVVGPRTEATSAARLATRRATPHLRHERLLLRDGAALVAGMDEVGRGSLAGPVSVGVVVVDVRTRSAPTGVADSKLLTPAARTAIVPALRRWGVARAVGHASAAEIDEVGIIAALRLAGTRALHSVSAVVGPVDVVLLDGSHDWLTPPVQPGLFDEPVDATAPLVRLRVKADRSCASVAAASVLAKTERDAMMVDLAAQHPAYRWQENKGYASPEHLAALRDLGPSVLHRRSWRLPGQGAGSADSVADGLDALVLHGLDAGCPGDADGLELDVPGGELDPRDRVGDGRTTS